MHKVYGPPIPAKYASGLFFVFHSYCLSTVAHLVSFMTQLEITAIRILFPNEIRRYAKPWKVTNPK